MRKGAWAAFVAAALTACATVEAPPRPPPPPGDTSLSRLPGWNDEDHAAAFDAVRIACAHASVPSSACAEALAQGRLGEEPARRFLEARFRAEPVAGEGLLTAYFSPEYPARRAPDAEFSAPVRPRPPAPEAAGDRAAIEASPAPDALAWMRPEDLFFLQVQGSGVLVFADGTRRRAAFAGSNGLAYAAIAGPMRSRGLPGADASAGAVRAWLAAHRGPAADAVMRLDPRYIFFRLQSDGGDEPVGGAGAPLLAGRSLAVDPAYHPYFELLWVDAQAPTLPRARAAYRRLAVSLDTGSAIKGEARADLYLGQGDAAGEEAGRVRHALRLYRIVPIAP